MDFFMTTTPIGAQQTFNLWFSNFLLQNTYKEQIKHLILIPYLVPATVK